MNKFEKLLGGVTVFAAVGYIYRVVYNIKKATEEVHEEESQ